MTRKLGVEVLGSVIEKRDGYSWHRLPHSRASLTCQLGKVAYQRSRYRRRGDRKSICPVDESPGLLAALKTTGKGKMLQPTEKA